MRLRIHRGANEIGGNCVELQAQGHSILLDLGLPLDAPDPDVSLLPRVAGLLDGLCPSLLGVVLSHTHSDHMGLTGLVHPGVPVFMGAHAQRLLRAAQPFLRETALPPTIRTYANEIPFVLGPFQITPFLTDHSAFDAYSLLVEAEGQRVFYSGDLRAHGRKARLVEKLLARPPAGIDILLLEGTTLSRPVDPAADGAETEHLLEERVLACMKESAGLVLAAFSPQNLDRFATMFRAARRSGRTFVSDIYLARLLDELALPSLPRAGEGLRVYLPDRQRRKMVAQNAFELVSRYRASRIYPEEIAAHPSRWVMLFRESMMADIDRFGIQRRKTLIYSLWPGYLDRSGEKLRCWCKERDIEFKVCHTSGHADPTTLIRLSKALAPRVVIPIHTTAPRKFLELVRNVRILNDLDWLEVSEA